jgi:NAD(P)-dependent dehydrogenase (short-subunit alcohol dehydrogenase family)
MHVSSLFSVAGKTVAISGGTRGLGLMIAKAFVANGAHAIISSRSAEACAAARAELEAVAAAAAAAAAAADNKKAGNLTDLSDLSGFSDSSDLSAPPFVGSCLASFPSDLSTEEGCVEFADGVAAALRKHNGGRGGAVPRAGERDGGGGGGGGGRGGGGGGGGGGGARECGDGLNVLVNNSGTSWGADSLEAFPAKGWDKVLDLNLKSVFLCTQLALPMLKRGAALSDTSHYTGQGNGGNVDGGSMHNVDPSRIINIGSVAGIGAGQPWRTYSYDASKAAVHHLTRRLSHELAASQITVNAIAPGVIPTSMSAQLETYASAEDQARAVPLQRLGAAEDIGGAALFLSSRAGSWVTGEVLRVDGGTCVRPHAMGQRES